MGQCPTLWLKPRAQPRNSFFHSCLSPSGRYRRRTYSHHNATAPSNPCNLRLIVDRQGEPGVGKTLLVEECGREWQREGVQVRAEIPDLSDLNEHFARQQRRKGL